jgi:hypothetical protein
MQTQSITPDKFFYSNDGKVFTSIEDLITGVNEMSEETFAYHFNKEKNDFYNWIYFVFNNEELAKGIQKVKTKSGFVKKVKEFTKETVAA